MNKQVNDFSEHAVKFFKENIDWDKSERQSLRNRATGWKWFSFAGWGVAVISIAAVIPLVVLHDFVPIPIVVDRFSGEYEVRVGAERVDMDSKKNTQRMVADVGRFMRAREGFTRGEAESNYQIVYYSLASDLRGAWDHEYQAELNPRSLLATLGPKDQIRVINPQLSWLPSDNPKIKVAQFRFDKERKLAGRPATRQPYVATLSFQYDTGNIPSTIDGLIANAFGFTVLTYSADAAGKERLLTEQEKQGAVQ